MKSKAALKRWHAAVRERDDSTCQYPGCEVQGEHLAAHHVYGRLGDLATDPDNGIYLCNKHHCLIEGSLTAFRGWFREMYPDRWERLKSKGLI